MAIAPELKEEIKPEVKLEEKSSEPITPPVVSPEAKRLADLEREIKERDAKISDLSTTISTIEERQRQIETAKNSKQTDDELEQRLQQIEEMRITDPQGAAKETAKLFKETQARASQQAQGAVSQQATLEKLKMGVKSSNPDFDDDVVDYVMERADMLARTGKFKTAEEAIAAATTLVKSKFDGYAQKRNSTPPLPEGAKAETGNNPPPTPVAKEPVIPSPNEELEARKSTLQRKII